MLRATACAKIILFGEHAVVYGQPAIAVPVSSLRASAVVEPTSPGAGLNILAADLNRMLPVYLDAKVDDALTLTAQLVLKHLDIDSPPDWTITLRSQIPLASGLGSGAAVSVALGRALSAALNHPLDNTELNKIVYEVEKIHHGTPSGIDNTVIVYEKPIYFVRNQPIEPITIAQSFSLLIADTGEASLTKIAVGDVRRLYEADRKHIEPVVTTIGNVVLQARRAIEIGDVKQLGMLMNENHRLLSQLTVSSVKLDQLVGAALKAGALGAKLSGGGRGGNMIALITPESTNPVREALINAGAVRVFETTIL